MRYTMECVECGNVCISPDGREPDKLQEYCELIVEMDLHCRKCDGLVVGRVAADGPNQVIPKP